MDRIKITVYGLFPTLLSTCAGCCPTQYITGCDFEEDQLQEYSPGMLRNQLFLNNLVSMLSGLGGRIEIEVVGADSIKGLILSARYGLGNGPAVIIGKKVFKGEDIDLDEVKKYLSSLIKSSEAVI